MKEKLVSYGGQAVIEGVMMRGRNAMAIAMRSPNGEIVTHSEPLSDVYSSRLATIPFLRGALIIWDTLGLGMRALTISANQQTGQDEKLEGPALYLSLGLALTLSVGLFFLLPAAVGSLVESLLSQTVNNVDASSSFLTATSLTYTSWQAWVGYLLEAVVRLLLVVGYIWAVGFMPDIRRVFAYHGAEHKTINTYRSGKKLTLRNVASYPVEHASCGTAFLLTLVILSVLFFSLLGPLPLLMRLVSRILLLPVLAGLAYEYIRWTANHLDSPFVRFLIRPNLALQSLTTREPDSKMLEVAISALKTLQQSEKKLELEAHHEKQ